MTTSEKYTQWVSKVIPFLERTGRALNRCCSVMQSKPVLDKQPQVLFLGYNAQEDFGFVPATVRTTWRSENAHTKSEEIIDAKIYTFFLIIATQSTF